MKNTPKFKYYFLHPKYWVLWLIIIFFYLLVLFPYSFLYFFGKKIGRIAIYFMRERVSIVRKNLELCFPTLSMKERENMLIKNFESVGLGCIETSIAWFWPDWRIRKYFKIFGYEHIKKALKKKGILIIGIHFLNLELGARCFSLKKKGIGVYRPNDNPLIDWIQYWGRLRSSKKMLDRKNLKGMIKSLRDGEILWYAADQDYGIKSSVFVPFFKIKKTATTAGTYSLIKLSKPAVIPFLPKRLSDGSGYELIFMPDISNKISIENKIDIVTYINKIIEKTILLAPEQYMWLHRRFKTRPKNEQSIYNYTI
ncbi:LpxL/LpxP family Kdo(2)-lipid IV(A) lauroyl/palmitoleoyl acyltransferase [Candidatus Tachikawaea gelatinosa]|uniref:Lipid A biosynthesis acyltransferase n=1 Tax=Candidatus Tachikawaea gelatinosa TaxID=1410383 RepID=A0A090APX8_9ENTR|nr:LpxL/LpxP family Kdo(2)-lipid IV(A) lauroyl/palmitoleoyl acyltransferase [Candidatus Tachikawaea gelatinosa]BAP58347.1 lipid A biosynthesis lauroyl acyltransferase [Candidatus Tachikawaea gelatinosa]